MGDVIDQAVGAPAVGRPAKASRARPAGERSSTRAAYNPEEPELPILPAGCPVKPLGKLKQICFYLDEAGQLIELDPQRHGKQHIRNLFGRQSHLCDEYWPRLDDKGEAKGHGQWHPEIAADLLMNACAFAGIFDPQGRVRGRGAHLGRDGEIVLHCGDTVYIAGADGAGYQEPGMIGSYVYPTAPAIPRPDPEAPSPQVAMEFLSLLRTWNWERPLIDPMLMLGWSAAAMLGGALGWRPHAWVTGNSATGKSGLQKLLELVFDGGALHTHDATEASLRQILGLQTLPVFFDEIEADEDNRRSKAVIKLARLASSGGVIFRGGQDHIGHEFTARSCFLFSSILLPPMLSQDRNRLAILELKPFDEGAVPPTIDEAYWRRVGRQFRARLVDQWHRFEETLHLYRVALSKTGHGGRSQDQFGTLLACADLMLYDHLPDSDVLAEWAAHLANDTLAERSTDLSDQEEAQLFLASTHLHSRGGDEPEPISRLLWKAINLEDPTKMRDRLENYGLKVCRAVVKEDGAVGSAKPAKGEPIFLAIANNHEALAKIFQGKRWAEGVWVQTFSRVVGAHKRVKVRFAGSAPIWSTLIPIEGLVDPERDLD